LKIVSVVEMVDNKTLVLPWRRGWVLGSSLGWKGAKAARSELVGGCSWLGQGEALCLCDWCGYL
jgi:hypothetical protein